MEKSLISRATRFADDAHRGQLRKWTEEPYIFHPLEVAQIVSTLINDSEVVAAAILHDVVEDTDVTIEQIEAEFGSRVAKLVDEVTKTSVPEDGNRATRKDKDRLHYSSGSYESQTIKLADIISNSEDIVQCNAKFAVKYLPEQRALAESLTAGHAQLREKALEILTAAEAELLKTGE